MNNMNKRLRRLLGRRKTNESTQNKGNKGKLPSLLSQRFNAAPNYYFKGDELNGVNLKDDLILDKSEISVDPKISEVERKDPKVPDAREVVIELHNSWVDPAMPQGCGDPSTPGNPPVSPTFDRLLRNTESEGPRDMESQPAVVMATDQSRVATSPPNTILPMTSSDIHDEQRTSSAHTSSAVTQQTTRRREKANSRDVTTIVNRARHDSDCDWGWVSISGDPPESRDTTSQDRHHDWGEVPPNKRVFCDHQTSCCHGDRWMTQPRCCPRHHMLPTSYPCQVPRQCCPNKRTATAAFSSCEHCYVTPSILFTISDDDATSSRPRVLEFPSRPYCDVTTEPMCCVHECGYSPELSTGRRVHCLRHRGHMMPPSLAFCEQEKMISTSRAPCCRARCCSLAPRSDEHEDNRNFAEHGKEHFQLSQKSYAKLIAYCESRKILSAHRGCSRAAAGNPTADSRRYSTVSPIHERANEVCRLARVLETVEECPWYWGGISGQDAKRKLRGTPPGTFLLRDSADPRFLYSLSLMTKSGPTSIRIVYNGGRFRFDSERDDVTSESRHPRSDTERRSCVVHMILRYTEYLRRHNELCNNSAATSRGDEKSERGQFMCYWMDNGGRREIPVLLTHPLPKKLISLQHSTRICLNKKYRIWETPELVDKFPLPVLMKSYIKKYPYPV